MKPEPNHSLTPQRIQPWGALAAIVVAFAAYAISQYVLFGILAIFAGIYGGETVESNLSTPWVSLVIASLSSAVMLGVVWLFLRSRHVRIGQLGFRKVTPKDAGLTLVGYGVYFLLLLVTIAVVTALVPGFDVDEVQEIGYEGANGWQLVLAFLGLVLLAPFAEEVFFRGFLYKGLARSWPKWLAALVSSLLFALAHFQWNVGIDVFIMSLIIIYLFEKTGNLWVCVGLHAVKNFVAFLALFVFAAS